MITSLAVSELSHVANLANCSNVEALEAPVQQAFDALHMQDAPPLGMDDIGDELMHCQITVINNMSVIRPPNKVKQCACC